MPKIQLELSTNEAVIFYDWVYRYNQTKNLAFADRTEQELLWILEARLKLKLNRTRGRS